MWLIMGPFDGEQGDVTTKKTKLLKTGKEYSLGRKEQPLVINNKKISREHVKFIVGAYLQENMDDVSFIPKLNVFNAKKTILNIIRDTETIVVNPSESYELQDGDAVHVLGGLPVEVRWHRVTCFQTPTRGKASVSVDAAAAVGIGLLNTPNSSITHHLTPSFLVNSAIMTSLLSATQLVKPEWLVEYTRLGESPEDDDPFGSALEKTFNPPPETRYRPTFSASLPSSLKQFKVWEPNEERINMLRGYRFILVSERSREVDGELRDLIVRGGGEYEAFSIVSGAGKWRQLLAKNKIKVDEMGSSGKMMVVVADEGAMSAALGLEQWQSFVADASSLRSRVISPENLLQAVANTDITYIEDHQGDIEIPVQEDFASSLPDFIPNTHPNEPSLTNDVPAQPIFPVPTSPPRAIEDIQKPVSQRNEDPPDLPPQPQEGEDVAEPPRRPRKTLIRRANRQRPTDTSESHATDEAAASTSGAEKPTTTSHPRPRSARLTRRAGTAIAPMIVAESFLEENGGTQAPSLSKFKDLFDASDPDKHEKEDIPIFGPSDGQSQITSNQSITQSETQAIAKPRSGAEPSGRLGVVMEEDEGRPSLEEDYPPTDMNLNQVDLAPRSQVGEQEATDEIDQQDGDMLSAGNETSAPKEPLRPIKPNSATQNKMDRDDAFLKAVASTKKGKKAEDSFDREFNNLRISRPDLQREEQEQEWAVLGDFDDIRNIRGNFMVVLEMDVFRKDTEHGQQQRAEWMQRPNFKKFKKKINQGSRKPVEVMFNEDNDYGVGSGYWKGGSQSSHPKGDSIFATQQSIPDDSTSKRKRRAFTVADSDEEMLEEEPVRKKSKNPAIKKEPASQAIKRSSKSSKGTVNTLFLPSDEEDEKSEPIGFHTPDDIGSGDNETSTMQSNDHDLPATRGSTTRRTAKGNKRTIAIADDESDDGATFKGFGSKRRKIGK